VTDYINRINSATPSSNDPQLRNHRNENLARNETSSHTPIIATPNQAPITTTTACCAKASSASRSTFPPWASTTQSTTLALLRADVFKSGANPRLVFSGKNQLIWKSNYTFFSRFLFIFKHFSKLFVKSFVLIIVKYINKIKINFYRKCRKIDSFGWKENFNVLKDFVLFFNTITFL
jgi:hypothetical protein